MMKRLMHHWDGYTLHRAQRQLRETRAHLERQRAEIDAAERWVARELERLGLERVMHTIRGNQA